MQLARLIGNFRQFSK